LYVSSISAESLTYEIHRESNSRVVVQSVQFCLVFAIYLLCVLIRIDTLVNILGKKIEVNADKTKYMLMSRDQNAGRSHSMKTNNSSFERVGEFNVWEQP
jgi:hypothetical protein